MTQNSKRFLYTIFGAIFLLSACLPGQAPTQNPVDIANQVATSVALTISAADAQTQAAQPLATNTTLPTQTEAVPSTATPIIPTATPFVLIPTTPTLVPSVGGGGGGGGGPVVKPELDCTVVNNVPRDNTVFHKNDTFDIVWTIVNTGTKTIPAKLDIKYLSGPDMAPGQSPYEIPVDIKPGKSHSFDLDGETPNQLGFHVMTWVVEGNLCYPYVAIIVE